MLFRWVVILLVFCSCPCKAMADELVESIYLAQSTPIPIASQEAEKLFQEGDRQYSNGLYKEAILAYQKAFLKAEAANDRLGTGRAFNSIGLAYYQLEEYSSALSNYQNALAVFQAINSSTNKAIVLNRIGLVYDKLGNLEESLDAYQQSLNLYSQVNENLGRSRVLHNLGLLYYKVGAYSLALEAYQKSLLFRQGLNDTLGEARIFQKIGNVYLDLGQHSRALEIYEKALSLSRGKGEPSVQEIELQGWIYNGIGSVYVRSKNYSKALVFYLQSLESFEKANDRSGLVMALNNLGETYRLLKQYQKASDNLQKALEIAGGFQDPRTKSFILDSFGTLYADWNKFPEAFDAYFKSSAISQDRKDRDGGRITLANLGDLFLKQKQPELAILFYKQSVKLTEEIRRELKPLSRNYQESYTQTVASTYRKLADLLLQQDRVLEAQQVLDLLKIQELDDYLRDVQKIGQRIEFLRPELEILKRYGALQKTAVEVGAELAELRKLDSKNALTTAQQQRLTQLAKLETEINGQFNTFLESEPIKRLTAELVRATNNQNLNLEDLVGLQSDLRKLNAALLYPLILEDRLELVIITPNAPPLRRTVKNLKREDLNRTIQQFRSALGNRQDNPQALAQQLYTWLIQPLEADLKQANIKTIIYAPDAQLRYIPLAALHDGNQWLIQKYRVQNITARAVTKLDDLPQPEKRIFAAAFGAKDMTVSVEGESFRFAGLPFAAKEVQSLAQAFPSTVGLLEQNFNRDAMLTRMNSFNLVHLATHGKFLIGKPDNSFLVTGDGKPINLKEIKNLPLSNVDLVVLSACETGIGITGQANGVEVLGLGYQFQRAGAKAAIASLWQVSDGGTERLMDLFYGLLKQGATKAEALQQAQIAMITGDFTAGGKLRGNFRIETTSNQVPIANSLKHPFYWAPFILIGNGL